MFANAKVGIAALAGTADNCTCIPRDQIAHEASTKYLLLDETPFIFLKSAKADHIFTDKAYVCAIGDGAMGTKRMVSRLDFVSSAITNVHFESAGMGVTDQDCELKFAISGLPISIDIRKSEIETAILYFRTLCALSAAQANSTRALTMFRDFNKITFQINATSADAVGGALNTAYATNLANSQAAMELMQPTSYRAVFEQYLGR